ncbi:aspartate/glutamate racemase family protein [Streptomyces albipurpureus]|uniref:Aspartate/glutamate racemase family protein n=1 Tax=Streptomyces albipurpureus TaxID=2897419 RepID=A0ABT0UM92_9ACTN|nr:aspartate/glutamate racemase family protein [Streptomyces sp. CWNU-1]MCM2389565.1 aspartate/glutamate racemase family protein [Streptomyces sp. CWNU-1]
MLALLHTSPVHVPVFDTLRDQDHPGVELLHLVHQDLLDRAVTEGADAVGPQVAEVLAGAVAQGATAILCTCSTLGAIAEASASELGVPVLRVDRPMAAVAARSRRIAVVAALHSTVEPTAALITDEVTRSPRPMATAGQADGGPQLRTVLVEGAWERFQTGDRDGYLDAVAAAVDEIGPAADVIVLAQASMADVAERVTTSVPVLSSPRPGLRAAVLAARSAVPPTGPHPSLTPTG